jgi:folylpolyglutamate synthase
LESYAEVWMNANPEAEVSLKRTIEEALRLAREIGDCHGGMQSLIVGSLHLVGGALCVLQECFPTLA